MVFVTGSDPWNKGLKGVQKGWNKGVPMTDSAKAKLSESLKGRVPWNKGMEMPDETKQKVSESCKAHWAEPENRQKLVDSHLGQKGWNKGLHMSEESKRRVSETKKAQKRKHTPEHKAKISKAIEGENNPFFGKHHSGETKRKIADQLEGRALPESVRLKMSVSLKKTYSNKKLREEMSDRSIGDRNPNWKGGISFEPYCQSWADKEFKESIKLRDSYKCQNPTCNGKSHRICLHHINYNKKDCHPGNLITVCISCNGRANANRDYWEQYYNDIMLYNRQLAHDQKLLKSISIAEYTGKLLFLKGARL